LIKTNTRLSCHIICISFKYFAEKFYDGFSCK